MTFLISIQILTQEIIQALNWTLLHSLWQGMVLAMVAGCIIFFTKKSRPAVRYNLLIASMLCFVIAVAVSFAAQIIKANEFANPALEIAVAQTDDVDATIYPMVAKKNSTFTTQALEFINANADWIVSIWLMLIGFRFVRLSVGLYDVYQLKKRQVSSPGEYWKKRVVELGEQLQITRHVELLQSAIATVPAVIGYFKPVILFPAGLLASLPASEVEAILMHELSHIRRKDFFVNVLQNVVEIIFFFNPGILWVSSLIKLDETTRSVGQKYFTQAIELKQGITLGFKHILNAKKVIMMASGVKKAAVIQKTIEEEITNNLPASILRNHSQCRVMIDEDAASLLNKSIE